MKGLHFYQIIRLCTRLFYLIKKFRVQTYNKVSISNPLFWGFIIFQAYFYKYLSVYMFYVQL